MLHVLRHHYLPGRSLSFILACNVTTKWLPLLSSGAEKPASGVTLQPQLIHTFFVNLTRTEKHHSVNTSTCATILHA